MKRADALKSVVDALRAEIAALKTFDVTALATATGEKEACLGALAGDWRDEHITEEIRALAQEAQTLNETARIYVNLMSANVRTRLESLTGLTNQVYAPRTVAA